MRMPMMQVRPMGMRMLNALVLVPMRMLALKDLTIGVFVLVMTVIMGVLVRMADRLVNV